MLITMALLNGRIARAQSEFARLSPFTDVEVGGDVVTVTYEGRTHELVSVQGVPVQRILAFCRSEYERRWEERFSVDLVEVMAALGERIGPTVRLELRSPVTGQVTTIERAPMSRENREAVRRAMIDRPWRRITPEQMHAAADAFEAALEERWSYLPVSRLDHRPLVADVRKRIDAGVRIDDFLIDLQRIVARGIDGHAEVRDWDRFIPRGALPLLIDSAGDRFVAFRPDRSAFLSDGHPYVELIDGRPISDWLAAAARFVPKGSPHYVRQHALRLLRSVQFLRKELNLPRQPGVEVTLTDETRGERRTVTVKVADAVPTYGVWPREGHQPDLPRGIAYLRLADMGAARGTIRITTALAVAAQTDAKGLILDVRDNGGGDRAPLRALAAFLMKPTDRPRVVNASVYRAHPEHGPLLMETRFLYPEKWIGWTAAERESIVEFKKSFEPEWIPPADGTYSDWHYMVLTPAPPDVRRFDKPLVILMNAKCFSATDVFLSALKGLPDVTLVGTPSSGGSANANTVTLHAEPFRARLGTMVSFQSDGKLFDTRGVQPDVLVEPTPGFFIGDEDNQLQAAVRIVERRKER
jgi:hypothetical protein